MYQYSTEIKISIGNNFHLIFPAKIELIYKCLNK